MNHTELEEGSQLALDFSKLQKIAATGSDVVPVVVQDATDGEVLILAYVNQQALDHSLRERVATFWSTSRNELWIKGATSGDTLELVEVRVNCEQNSLLFKVKPLGKGACHTSDGEGVSRKGCYYRELGEEGKLRHSS